MKTTPVDKYETIDDWYDEFKKTMRREKKK